VRSHELITLLFAVWGAVISTFLAALKIAETYKDGRILSVSVWAGMRANAGSPYGDMILTMVKVVNVGRLPVSVTNVWLMHRESNLLCGDPYSAKYPVELAEGKHHLFLFNEEELKGKFGLRTSQYVAGVSDATGTTYWSHGPLARFWKAGRLR
jgi:hypothetical protein